MLTMVLVTSSTLGSGPRKLRGGSLSCLEEVAFRPGLWRSGQVGGGERKRGEEGMLGWGPA